MEKRDDRYLLNIRLPFVEKGDIDLTHSGDELIVHIGNRKRNIILPRALTRLNVLGAEYDEDTLVVAFGKDGSTQ